MKRSKSDTCPRVGIVGDSILDEYVYGHLIHGEIDILKTVERHFYLGGAANVALNVKKMGCESIFFSVLGTNDISNNFCSLMENEGIITESIIKEESRGVSHKIRLLTNDEIIIRIDNDLIRNISELSALQLYRLIEKNINTLEVLVLSDYDKGCITEKMFSLIKELCHIHDVKLIVDCKRKHDFSGIYLLKPNLAEFETITNRCYSSIEEVINYGIEFKKENNIINLLITMDKEGLLFFNECNQYKLIPSLCNAVVDSCGAGDAMMAALSTSIANKKDIQLGIHNANQAAAICCSKIGTYAVSQQELNTFRVE